jgi:ferredoxin
MAVRIAENCVTCGACIWECPTQAIHPGPLRPVVEESSCTECYGFFGESQCIVVCPASAIFVEPEPLEDLTTRYRALHSSRAPQDTWIWRRIERSPAC